jgi:hypothetical protein
MNSHRKVVFLVLLCAALFMASAVFAKQAAKDPAKQPAKQGTTLERHATELKPMAPKSSFSGHFGGNSSRPAFLKDSCSGSCDCGSCSCYGTYSCCSGGCDACWAYRDSRGLCDAVQ